MTTRIRLMFAIGTLFLAPALIMIAATESQDPGPRGGPAAAGGPLPGLTAGQLSAFMDGADDFNSSHSVDGSIRDADATGLGPTFNLENCGGCHATPDVGGTSPARNPQFESAFVAGAVNHIPSFLQRNGPVLEARFVVNPDGSPDGAVHNLFTIAGRSDAPGCNLRQPDFDAESRRGNLALRIPTPTFGDGLLENIPKEQILANKISAQSEKAMLGITGRENRNLQDGTITRLGWKAQNPSLMNFAGEAYSVEMGVTNEVFPNERSAACQFTPTPEDHPDFEGGVSGVQHFTDFMRLLAPAQPAEATASTVRGQQVFASTGCAMCHTPTLKTRGSDIAALSNQFVNLYSDLLLHDMGRGLADPVSQGLATGNEFRTAPLWGIGQRLFFLHDGRTSDLKAAILAHESPGSEANAVIGLFKAQPASDQQHLLNFLRAL